MKEKNKELFGYILSLCLAFSVALYTGINVGYNKGQERLNDMNMDFWLEQESESQYNFEVMRDLFTPSGYNDTVTIVHAPEVNWSFTYWVNHSNICNSFFFDNMKSYHVLFPMWGKLEVL